MPPHNLVHQSAIVVLMLYVFLWGSVHALQAEGAVNQGRSSRPPGPGPWPPAVCNTTERGPHLQARQQAALDDWAVVFYQNKDVLTSFNRWIPGQWINHSPGATAQGREDAIRRLTTGLADPRVTMTNTTVFAGQGYGFVHFKFSFPTVVFAAWHSFKFEGTCFVEHWDGVQQIFGNETNPIAFF